MFMTLSIILLLSCTPYIGQLDVAIYFPLAVAEVNGDHQLLENKPGHILWEAPPPSNDVCLEILTINILWGAQESFECTVIRPVVRENRAGRVHW
jgi:hypothetical protein